MIKTTVIISLVLFLLIGISYYTSSTKVAQLRSQRNTLNLLKSSIVDMTTLTDEYRQNKNERVLDQWNSRYRDGRDLIDMIEKDNRILVTSLDKNLNTIEVLFSDVVNNNQAEYVPTTSSALENEMVLERQKNSMARLHIELRSAQLTANTLEENSLRTMLKIETFNKYFILSLLGLFILFNTGMLLTLASRITKSLDHMVKVSKELSNGKLLTRVKLTTHDEFMLLGTTMNSMAVKLRKNFLRTKKIEQEKLKLAQDSQITLKKKISELERWKKVTIERELRMKEIKAELAALKGGTNNRTEEDQDWTP